MRSATRRPLRLVRRGRFLSPGARMRYRLHRMARGKVPGVDDGELVIAALGYAIRLATLPLALVGDLVALPLLRYLDRGADRWWVVEVRFHGADAEFVRIAEAPSDTEARARLRELDTELAGPSCVARRPGPQPYGSAPVRRAGVGWRSGFGRLVAHAHRDVEMTEPELVGGDVEHTLVDLGVRLGCPVPSSVLRLPVVSTDPEDGVVTYAASTSLELSVDDGEAVGIGSTRSLQFRGREMIGIERWELESILGSVTSDDRDYATAMADGELLDWTPVGTFLVVAHLRRGRSVEVTFYDA